ncbi:hypothetical protein M427DRAFT_33195 [Gonapodya prolifera JEL478]|uniref:Uncharacterized protein n=1 Tax=Gonapodya prolifera (strain JEL478) TaxID=1344416 RepID=A0A139ABR5_GONPJ|nr:hypothetical protein M427DRAFT_33195 [Gonapodya prolifera JEL478]|eukprot:KXS14246.1 hypothetical protein M427DRAFT_33195 [Gonapodya prolifera JEL478]
MNQHAIGRGSGGDGGYGRDGDSNMVDFLPAEAGLRFSNMVLQNTDPVMVEARGLISSWLEDAIAAPNSPSPITTRGNPRKPASFSGMVLRLKEEVEREFDIGKGDARRIHDVVEAAVGDGVKTLSTTQGRAPCPTQDLRVSIEARQKLAAERRRRLALERQVEVESRMRAREDRMRQERYTMELEVARIREETRLAEQTRQEAAQRAAEADVNLAIRRVNELQTAKRPLRPPVTAKKGTHVRDPGHRTLRKDVLVQKEGSDNLPRNPLPESQDPGSYPESLERNRKLEKSRAKAEELFAVHNLRRLRAISSFRRLSSAFHTWSRSRKSRVGERDALNAARIAREEAEKEVRALRAWRFSALGKSFSGWREWLRVEKEERELRRQHSERAARIQAFLRQVQKTAALSTENLADRVVHSSASTKVVQDEQNVDKGSSTTVSELVALPVPCGAGEDASLKDGGQTMNSLGTGESKVLEEAPPTSSTLAPPFKPSKVVPKAKPRTRTKVDENLVARGFANVATAGQGNLTLSPLRNGTKRKRKTSETGSN